MRLTTRHRGLLPYEQTLAEMRAFTDARNTDTPDELWLLQHLPVYTQGQAGKPEHLLIPSDIPVVYSDRGGQITYHGPGQLIAYVMIDLHRAGYGVRGLVRRLEASMLATLALYGIEAFADPAAPGVYVDVRGERRKVGSLGLRVRKGCSYHGLALNVDADLGAFDRINPCGYPGLRMTQVRDLGGPGLPAVSTDLQRQLCHHLQQATAVLPATP